MRQKQTQLTSSKTQPAQRSRNGEHRVKVSSSPAVQREEIDERQRQWILHKTASADRSISKVRSSSSGAVDHEAPSQHVQRRLQESQDIMMRNSREEIGLANQMTSTAEHGHGARSRERRADVGLKPLETRAPRE